MIILGIETSCDETGVALAEKTSSDSFHILSNIIASSFLHHAKTGGIIPEIAAREQIKVMLPVLKEALQSGLHYTLGDKAPPPIDAIAVTYGPGLIGSLLVGVETAKTLSLLWNKPLIPINHMHGHIFANFISDDQEEKNISLPAIALVVSGGHTDLLILKEDNTIEVLGGTRDDAAGEAFDKIGRLMGFPYPAGATISRLALNGDPKAFVLPRPMIGSKNYEFSFSGLKTAVYNLVKKNNWDFADESFLKNNEKLQSNLCACVEHTIVDVLVKKTIAAAKEYNVSSILLGGGVAANNKLRSSLQKQTELLPTDCQLFVPSPALCTDNGAMIAAAGFFSKHASWKDIEADPQLYY